MNLEIFWTSEAKKSLSEIIYYLEKEWPVTIVTTFINRIDEVLDTISKNYSLYPKVDKQKNIYRCVVVTQVSLYYRIKANQIELITFWDNRQNPELLKL